MSKRRKDVIGVAMQIFYQSINPARIERSVRQIVRYLSGQPVTQWGAMLDRIIGIIAVEGYNKGQSDLWERHNRLGQAIARLILKQRDVRLLCQYCLVDSRRPKSEYGAERASLVIPSAFFRYIGENLERTLEFCRLIFTALARLDEKEDGYERIKARGNLAFPLRIWQNAAISLACPALDETPQKLWIANLVAASGEGNQLIDEYLNGVFHLLNLVTKEKNIPVISQSELERQTDGDFQKMNRIEKYRIVVPDHLMVKMSQFIERRARDKKWYAEEAGNFKTWFLEHREALGRVFDAKCLEMLDRPRYGLRPDGFDSCLIRVSSLNAVGVQSFSFYPEGQQFPDVRLTVACAKSGGPILCQYTASLKDFELAAMDLIFENWQGEDIAYLRSVLEYVIVDAMHRIVVGEPAPDLADEEVVRPQSTAEAGVRKMTQVRPFMRRLPLGFKASATAKNLAQKQMGWVLPEGLTYVQTHARWIGLPEGQRAPLFIYDDQAVMKSIVS